MAVKTNPTTGKSPAAAWPRRKSAWKRTLKCRSSSVKTVNLVLTKSMSKTTWSISLTLLAPENWKHVCQVLQKPMQIKGKCFLLWSNLDLSNGSNSPHLGTSWLSTLVCFGEHRISPNQSARAGIVSHDQTGSEWDALWNCKALPLHCVTGSSKSRLSPLWKHHRADAALDLEDPSNPLNVRFRLHPLFSIKCQPLSAQ